MKALPLVLALAGCLSPGVEGESWELHGAFTADRTQADMDAWCEVARAYGQECLLMESFPEQFRMSFSREVTCQEARQRVVSVPHTTAGACLRLMAD